MKHQEHVAELGERHLPFGGVVPRSGAQGRQERAVLAEDLHLAVGEGEDVVLVEVELELPQARFAGSVLRK
jgi:hypothetical protein